jgi:molecular chaperone DnaK (HSP70)
MNSDYVIGIDLGTTNTVVAFASLKADAPAIELLPITQTTAANTIESRPQLPSFLYLATESEQQSGTYRLPWSQSSEVCIGTAARTLSAQTPERTISAAKSWLCHSRVDRRQPILPWQAPAGVPKMSPLEASRRLLEHVAAVWNHTHPDHPFGDQQIVLTVPASFDASAANSPGKPLCPPAAPNLWSSWKNPRRPPTTGCTQSAIAGGKSSKLASECLFAISVAVPRI